MRLGNPSTQRPAYHDRAPSSTVIGNNTVAVAPHAEVVRATYTVPTGRKALVTAASVNMARVTVAAPSNVAMSLANIFATPFLRAVTDDNTLGLRTALAVSTGMVLLVGQTATLSDSDISTGGTCSFWGTIAILEFDV